MSADRYATEVAALATRLAATPRAVHPLVVYGSSTVRLWTRAATDLGRADALAVGFGGATLLDLARHYDTLVAALAPDALVVAAGANDLEQGDASSATIVARVADLIERARRHDPDLPIALLTLKPAPYHAARMPVILATNRALAEALPAWPGVALVDTCTPFLDRDGLADARYYAEDRRHMNAEGYALWASLLARALDDDDPRNQRAMLRRRHP